jgi:hypothetical protein
MDVVSCSDNGHLAKRDAGLHRVVLCLLHQFSRLVTLKVEPRVEFGQLPPFAQRKGPSFQWPVHFS